MIRMDRSTVYARIRQRTMRARARARGWMPVDKTVRDNARMVRADDFAMMDG